MCIPPTFCFSPLSTFWQWNRGARRGSGEGGGGGGVDESEKESERARESE